MITKLDKPNRRRRRRKSMRQRLGATTVEFALSASILFLIVFGAIEFCRMCMLRNLAQDACYEAARYCMVEGATTGEAWQHANDVMQMMGAKEVDVVINDGDGIDDDSGFVRVYVELPMAENSLILPWIYGDRVVSAEIQLKMERYNGYYNTDE